MASLLIKSAFHNAIAEGIYNEVLQKTGKYYYFLGKTLAWNVDDEPEVPQDTFNYEMDVRKNIIFGKLITGSDISLVVPRYDWKTGEVYDMYDDRIDATNPAASGATSIEAAKFYVLTNQYNVYKCLDNNLNAKSVNMPTHTSDTPVTYGDGYKWKFMYTIPASMRNKFLTTAYMPVYTSLTNQFYSAGEITSLTIDDGGSGYSSASFVIQGDGYIENNPYIISLIEIIDQGDGYGSAPAVTISAPSVISGDEVQATATASLTSTKISSVSITEAGYGYTDNATISVAAPFSGSEWVASNSVSNDDYIHHNGIYYKVVGTGLTGTLAPTHTTGTVANGAVSLQYAGKQAILNIVFVKTEASITPIVDSGEITGFTINDGGIGYTYAFVTVTGDGDNAAASVNFNIGNIDSLQSNVELLAVPGAIEAIKITNAGAGYGAATVAISGDGTGATATAVVEGGQIKRILVTNAGEGYTYANITISGNGSGATARAIIPPIGGHGKNAVNELFARTLIFFTTISAEKNQGLNVNNDYRQTGIIKQIDQYNTDLKYKNLVGSACFKIAASINTAQFPNDTIVYETSSNKRYLIVQSTSDAALMLPLDGTPPEIGKTYRNVDMVTFNVSNVTAPQIDVYSGDLLFVDNRAGFIPSNEQTITVRTIIGF
jgi:hypothetical protein